MSRRPVIGGLLASAAVGPSHLGRLGRRVTKVALPANVLLARDLRNGWGVCTGLPNYPTTTAGALAYLNTRWIRGNYIVDSVSYASRLTAVNTALAQMGAAQPKLSVQCLVFAYMNNLAVTWAVNQTQLLQLRSAGVLATIEGPNEMNSPYVGNGSHGPNDTVNCADPRYGASGDGSWPTKFRQWVSAMATFRAANQSLAGVTLSAPTVAVAPVGGNGAGYFDQLPDVSASLNYGTTHYYAGSGHADNLGYTAGADGSINGNFYNTYFHTQRAEKAALILSECGASTDGNGYGRDGISQCRYVLNQFFDLFAMGGRRVFFYGLFDGTGNPGDYEGNFGLFKVDGTTPKPAATALANIGNLLSLRNAWSNAANLTDTAPYTPGYVGAGLSIAGMTNASVSGQYLVLPKTDGTTMIAVWNEPDPLDPYTATPASVTVNLGSSHAWNLYDPTGSTGGTLTPALSVAPLSSGYGASVSLTLRGYPMLIELTAGGGGPGG